MRYKNNVPEFMPKSAINYVNKRFDITEKQAEKLAEIQEALNIPPSAAMIYLFTPGKK